MNFYGCDLHDDCYVVYGYNQRSSGEFTCPQCAKEDELEEALKQIEELKEKLENVE